MIGGWIVAGTTAIAIGAGAARAADVSVMLDRLLPSCAGCHGDDGRSGALPAWGRIAGQNYGYLVYVLKLYRSGGRSGVNAGMMGTFVARLNDSEIEALARHYASLEEAE